MLRRISWKCIPTGKATTAAVPEAGPGRCPSRRSASSTAGSRQRQIRNTGAELVVTSCHNCRDQILKSLRKEYNLDIEVKYLWELVADSLIIEPKEDEA